MNVYIKGGLGVFVLMAVLFALYSFNKSKLPAYRSPDSFMLIDRMEQHGVPDFTLQRLDGSPLTLSQYTGQIIIVNFWASWCNPCVQEFPSLMKLVEHFKGEVVVIAVSTDENQEDIEAFTKAFGLPRPGFEIVWDKDKTMMEKYGIEKIPESFLVDGERKLIRKVLGIEDWYSEDALAYFRSLLDAKKKSADAR